MTPSIAVAIVLVVAALAANLPFVNDRLFGVLPLRFASSAGRKPFGIRLVEVLLSYLVVLAVGFALESSIGGAQSQGWQFYVVTLCLFIVAAWPGFVWRYLRRGARR